MEEILESQVITKNNITQMTEDQILFIENIFIKSRSTILK
jgi:hypothetical protein